MEKILIGTRNKGKFNGLMVGLQDLPFNFVSLMDEKIEGDPEEIGETYEANATLKSTFFAERSGIMTLADDSGIVVEALKDELGVKTRRWGAGHEATDEEWLDFFLKRMAKEKNRRAKFICVVALTQTNGKTELFRGETQGTLLEKPPVPIEKGIPLSAVFLPDGWDRVYSALRGDEFLKVSHRGRAVRLCHDYLQKSFAI